MRSVLSTSSSSYQPPCSVPTTSSSRTFTFSKNDDGTPKAVVSTMAGGESVAKSVVIKGDTIIFTRDISVQGLTGSVTYTAKLVDGTLKGTGDVKLAGADGGMPTAFTATRAK